MIIQSLKKHFRVRLSEWIMVGWGFTWGTYVLFNPHMFTDSATRAVLAGMADLAAITGTPPATFWGFIAIVVSMLRGFALFINGAYSRSPIIRLLTSALSGSMVLMILLGVIGNGVPSTGIPTYAWLFLLDLASAYHAACDIPPAEHNRLVALQEAGRGRYSRSGA